MRLLATIEDPRVVEQVLAHLGLPSAPGAGGPRPAAACCGEPLRGHARLTASPSALTRALTRWYVFHGVRWVGARPGTSPTCEPRGVPCAGWAARSVLRCH